MKAPKDLLSALNEYRPIIGEIFIPAFDYKKTLKIIEEKYIEKDKVFEIIKRYFRPDHNGLSYLYQEDYDKLLEELNDLGVEK